MTFNSKMLAKKCGVSRGTVDRALHDRPGVNPETKARILRAAQEYGYTPDLIGRSLSKGRTKLIGVIIHQFMDPYQGQIINAMESSAKAYGYNIMVMMSDDSIDNEMEAIMIFKQWRVDGLILHPIGFNQKYKEFIRKTQLPLVTFGNKLSGFFDFVGIDNKAAAAEATRHILDHGYQRILFLSPYFDLQGKINLFAHEERLAGFLAITKEQNISHDIIRSTDYLPELIAQIKRTPLKTALFCCNDMVSLEVLNAIYHQDAEILQSVGIMGFIGIDMLKYIQPQLATVKMPINDIASGAVDRLIYRIKHEKTPPDTILYPHSIVPGNSL